MFVGIKNIRSLNQHVCWFKKYVGEITMFVGTKDPISGEISMFVGLNKSVGKITMFVVCWFKKKTVGEISMFLPMDLAKHHWPWRKRCSSEVFPTFGGPTTNSTGGAMATRCCDGSIFL
jgi:hypothetical protein